MPNPHSCQGFPPNSEFLPPGSNWRAWDAPLDSGFKHYRDRGGKAPEGQKAPHNWKFGVAGSRENLGLGEPPSTSGGVTCAWTGGCSVSTEGGQGSTSAIPGHIWDYFLPKLVVFFSEQWWEGALCLPATAMRWEPSLLLMPSVLALATRWKKGTK